MAFEVKLVSVSLIMPVPELAGLLIPALADLLHPKVVPAVRLPGV